MAQYGGHIKPSQGTYPGKKLLDCCVHLYTSDNVDVKFYDDLMELFTIRQQITTIKNCITRDAGGDTNLRSQYFT